MDCKVVITPKNEAFSIIIAVSMTENRGTKMNLVLINNLAKQLRQIASNNGIAAMAYSALDASRIRESIMIIARDVAKDEPQVSNLLIRAKDNIFFSNQIGQAVLNPYALGETVFGLDLISSKYSEPNKAPDSQKDKWSYIHPLILKSSKKLFDDGHFANAAEDAFIEINDRVKKLFAIIRPGEDIPDGESAMTTVFSAKNPIVEFCDQSTLSGQNKQKGYMQMLSGAISALRNPKAHSNEETLSADEAYRRLVTASMLMYAIDDAVEHSNISE